MPELTIEIADDATVCLTERGARALLRLLLDEVERERAKEAA